MDTIVSDCKLFMETAEQPLILETAEFYYKLVTQEELIELREAREAYLQSLEVFKAHQKLMKPRLLPLKLLCPETPEETWAAIPDKSCHQLQVMLRTYADDCLKARAEVFDAIFDVIWELVCMGLSLELPLTEGWLEGAHSNLAKLQKGKDGKLLRREDGKILKPSNWTPPNFYGLLTSQAAMKYAEKKLKEKHSLKNDYPDK